MLYKQVVIRGQTSGMNFPTTAVATRLAGSRPNAAHTICQDALQREVNGSGGPLAVPVVMTKYAR